MRAGAMLGAATQRVERLLGELEVAACVAALVVVAVVAGGGVARASTIVSLGDSYSSGEGAAPYDADSDSRTASHKCHRSPDAWPRLIGVTQEHHLACSGAVIDNVDRRAQTDQVPDDQKQLERLGQISQQTAIDRVVMTIGGNDKPLNFAKRLWKCPSPLCLRDVNTIVKQLPGLRARLTRVYGEAILASGGAPLLVVGYPDLFPRPGSPSAKHASRHCPLMRGRVLDRVAKLEGKVEEMMSAAARAVGASYLSMRDVLSGHELCTGTAYIRSLGGKPGDVGVGRGGLRVDQQQGHPLKEGQVLMALRVLGWLARHRPKCTPTSNVAAIVDDSGSMADNDPANIRRRALELLLTKPTNQARTFGAIQFAGDAGPLFPPQIVGSGRASMIASLDALQNDGYGDVDGTDYNAAFAESAAEQPAAGARIFLTDGLHNQGTYENGHLGGPPTFVIGLNIGPASTGDEGALLLDRIATDTGGRYYPLQLDPGDSASVQESRLQAALNDIDASINCNGVQSQATVTLRARGRPSLPLKAVLGRQPGLEIVLSWADPRAVVGLGAVNIRDRAGRVIADLRGGRRIPHTKRRRAKIITSTVRGQTFQTITLRRPRTGVSVAATVTASTLPAPIPVTIQMRPVATAPSTQGGPAAPPPPFTPPPPPVTPPPRVRVNAYDNYGSGAAGHAMCRGNPGNALSVPGGTVQQTFTVPAGVASLDTALVQIDPDNRVAGHLSLAINGIQRATADAAAAGDTTFSFPPVPVAAGDNATIGVSFTATFGKIITVYSVGGGRGTFTTSNACPDGAENITTSSTALRAVVSGYNR